MIHYEITRRDGPSVLEFVHVKNRREAAHDALYAAVVHMLEGNGLMDRPVALRLASEVMNANVTPPKRGMERSQYFRLGGTLMDHVHLYVYRTIDGRVV